MPIRALQDGGSLHSLGAGSHGLVLSQPDSLDLIAPSNVIYDFDAKRNKGLDGSDVDTWGDLGPNGIQLVAVATAEPQNVVSDSDALGYPAVQFDSDTIPDRMEADADYDDELKVLHSSNPYTMMYAFKPDASRTDSTLQILAGTGSTATSQRGFTLYYYGDTEELWLLVCYGSSGNVIVQKSLGYCKRGVPHCVVIRGADSQTNDWQAWVDGVQMRNLDYDNSEVTPDPPTNRLKFGVRPGSGDFGSDINLYRTVAWNTLLSDADVTSIFDWASANLGIDLQGFLVDWARMDFSRSTVETYGDYDNPYGAGGATVNEAAANEYIELTDGEGRSWVALMGSLTNQVADSNDIGGTNWTNSDGTATLDDDTAPNTIAEADRFEGDNSAPDYCYSGTTSVSGGIASAWIRSYDSNVQAHFRSGAGSGANLTGVDLDISDSWDRYSVLDADVANNPNIVFVPAHTGGAVDGSIATPNGIFVWGVQYDDDRTFLGPLVETTGIAATKDNDDLRLPIAPWVLRAGIFEFYMRFPFASRTEVCQVLYFDGSNFFRANSSAADLRVVAGGNVYNLNITGGADPFDVIRVQIDWVNGKWRNKNHTQDGAWNEVTGMASDWSSQTGPFYLGSNVTGNEFLWMTKPKEISAW